MAPDALRLRFGGALVEQLGAQLYPSATATVAELISNAWDADATKVWVTIPFAQAWTSTTEIVVVDNGHGMTRTEAQDAYLIVGRKRRLELGDKSRGGRAVHGRKGIGKLAAFGTAGILDCTTRANGETTAFRLDYDEIRKLDPDKDYEVEDLPSGPALCAPDGTVLESGTRIRLTRLRLKRSLSEDSFLQSMSRRFALGQTEMTVEINGARLQRFDIPVQFKFPRDGAPDGVTVDSDGWGTETLDGQPIRWWIGFTAAPLPDETLQGISILARGKMAQRPFKFERTQGTEGQLGQEYLVGEVQADWLDHGVDIEDDLIQSNRDQLQLEDRRLDPLMAWGRARLAWALRERNKLRQNANLKAFDQNAGLTDLLSDFTKAERTRYFRVAQVVSRLPEVDTDDVVDMMKQVINAQSDLAVRQMMEDIENLDLPVQEEMWRLVRNFGLIDARRNATLIEARLATIAKLASAVAEGMTEVPHLHEIVRKDTWLLDPRWHFLDDEVDIKSLDIDFDPELDENGQRLDFLFALRPRPPAEVDQIVVVEIKRGHYESGKLRRVTETEIDKFHGYVVSVVDHYSKGSRPPAVHGLMVAQDYSAKADRKRRTFERVPAPTFIFKTWDTVIDETRRMHEGWLAVSQRRSDEPETDA